MKVDYDVYSVVITRYADKIIIRFPDDWHIDGFDLDVGRLNWSIRAMHRTGYTAITLTEYEQKSYQMGHSILILAKRVVLQQGEE